MGIKKNNEQKIWEVQEGIIGKFLSIIGASLVALKLYWDSGLSKFPIVFPL